MQLSFPWHFQLLQLELEFPTLGLRDDAVERRSWLLQPLTTGWMLQGQTVLQFDAVPQSWQYGSEPMKSGYSMRLKSNTTAQVPLATAGVGGSGSSVNLLLEFKPGSNVESTEISSTLSPLQLVSSIASSELSLLALFTVMVHMCRSAWAFSGEEGSEGGEGGEAQIKRVVTEELAATKAELAATQERLRQQQVDIMERFAAMERKMAKTSVKKRKVGKSRGRSMCSSHKNE